MKKIYLYIFCLILTYIVYLTMPSVMLKYYPLGDATIFEYFGYAMGKGEKLYIDLFDHKGPIIFFINYIGYQINGYSGIKLIYLICYFIFLLACHNISNIFSNKYIVSCINMIILTIIFLNIFQSGLGLEGYMLPFISYSLFIYLDYFINNNYSNKNLIILGFCFGIVFFTKYNMVGIWFLLSLIITINLILKKEYNLLFKFINMFLIGFLLITIPIIAYFIINDSLYQMVYQSLIVNLNYSGDSPIGIVNVVVWLIEIFNQYYLFFIILISSIIYKDKRISLYGVLLLLFCIILSIISKRLYLHYLIVLLPLFTSYITIFIDSIFNFLKPKLTLLLIVIFIVISYFPSLSYIKYQIENRTLDYSKDITELAEHIKINTEKNDKIYGHRMYGSIYLLSDRLSSTKYFFIPGFYNEDIFYEDFKLNFENNYPKYISIDESKKSLLDSKIDNYIYTKISEKYILEKKVNNISLYKKN